jgi:UDP-2-acetamido-3-amino-2,3-dideoxy-glucuronate N-acetyltransferase
MIHSSADVQTETVGEGTLIWQYCVVLSGAVIGRDCNVNAHCLIEGGVVIGDRVTVKAGVYLWAGVHLENDVFVGPNVTFVNDPRPRSQCPPASWGATHVSEGASIGAGATILSGVTVGRYALVGAGSVVTHDVAPHELWYGNPARPHGFVCVCGERLSEDLQCLCGRCFEVGGPRSGLRERTETADR